MATRPREWDIVKLRRGDWQRIIDAVAASEVSDDERRKLVTMLFVQTGIDPSHVSS